MAMMKKMFSVIILLAAAAVYGQDSTAYRIRLPSRSWSARLCGAGYGAESDTIVGTYNVDFGEHEFMIKLTGGYRLQVDPWGGTDWEVDTTWDAGKSKGKMIMGVDIGNDAGVLRADSTGYDGYFTRNAGLDTMQSLLTTISDTAAALRADVVVGASQSALEDTASAHWTEINLKADQLALEDTANDIRGDYTSFISDTASALRTVIGDTATAVRSALTDTSSAHWTEINLKLNKADSTGTGADSYASRSALVDTAAAHWTEIVALQQDSVAQFHRVDTLASAGTGTWYSVKWDTLIDNETTGGYTFNYDSTGFIMSVSGTIRIQGCGHWHWNGGNTEVKAYLRGLVNTSEARCIQASDTRTQLGGEYGTLDFEGTIAVSAGDSVFVQYQVSDVDMDWAGAAVFDNPVAFSVNFEKISN